MKKARILQERLELKILKQHQAGSRDGKLKIVLFLKKSTGKTRPSSRCSWKLEKNILPQYLEKYSENDIYNCDETGLYYWALPDRSMCFSTDKPSGG